LPADRVKAYFVGVSGGDMRAIAIQCAPCADKAANIATLDRLIPTCLDADRPALVSLPEMWSCLGADRATKLAQGESLPPPGGGEAAGPAYRFLRDTARRLRITLHGGSIGELVGDTLFNTTLVFDPEGREIGRYRKIHLFDVTTPNGQGYRESSLFGAGSEIVTCRMPATTGSHAAGITLGLTICYDLRFAELFLALRRAGADIILVPAAFTAETGRDHWEVLLRARAIETQCWIVAAATTGTHFDAAGRPRETFGHSMICDPWGRVQACAQEGEFHAAATIDMAELARVRAGMPVLEHRRLA
jgi:nitrilase